MLLAGGMEDHRRRLGFWEAGADFFAPELPDVGAGEEEGAVGFSVCDLLQPRVEGAEELSADAYVVGGGGEFELDRLGGHASTIVAQSGPLPPKVCKVRTDKDLSILGPASDRGLVWVFWMCLKHTGFGVRIVQTIFGCK